MKAWKRFTWLACALALGAAVGGSFAAATGMSKEAYKAAGRRIEAQQAVDLKACARLHGNAQDVCKLQAKGNASMAEAALDAKYKPSPEAEREAREAKADADYAVAKAHCEDARKGEPREACLDRAATQHDGAIRLAKIERVQSSVEARAKAEQRKMGAAPETPAARYAAEKARCEMLGTQRDHCLADARQRFHKA